MLENLSLENILFLDIETVSCARSFDELDERMHKLWAKKSERLRQDESETPESLYSKAGIYSEFGKIICICVGIYRNHQLRIKAFAGENEAEVLKEMANLLNTHYHRSDHLLCAHNGKEFDFPYMSRRMLINGIKLPSILDTAGKKPWEVNHLDTMELWKFGDYKNYTSLELLAAIFDIQTPKDDIDGSQVNNIFWQENDLERIVKYCRKDVLTIFQILRRYRGEPLIDSENVIMV
ncbi:MAG: 3'-5' exonuclease [Bacteroidales bacterium]|nr:3'-5' exonuclease [Bacteroidales bacterium]